MSGTHLACRATRPQTIPSGIREAAAQQHGRVGCAIGLTIDALCPVSELEIGGMRGRHLREIKYDMDTIEYPPREIGDQ
eukprot:3939268-Rhodomonas_salina.1